MDSNAIILICTVMSDALETRFFQVHGIPCDPKKRQICIFRASGCSS